MYLLDTVVLSELRTPPRQRNRHLVHWFGEVPSQDLFVSVLTVGEIARGIERQRQLNPEFAERIASWLDMILRTYEGRILDVDVAVARRWGRLPYLIIRESTLPSPRLHSNTASPWPETCQISTRRGVPVFNPFSPRSARKP
jgi:predicted nucleic acid-binding protein